MGMADSATESLVFTDDVTADRSSRMNSDVHGLNFPLTFSQTLQTEWTTLTAQMDNDRKHTAKATHELLNAAP